ncbi:MAG: PEP-CTERM sorting domain-containing protein [Sphaerotilus sp.]|nr:PEP-CTERM sorting domain-containing protein [Sphaerotilus sp.]
MPLQSRPLLLAALVAFSCALPAQAMAQAAISVGSLLPTADEQASLDQINRFRADPQGELGRMLGVSASALGGVVASSGANAGNGTVWNSGYWNTLTGGNAVANALDFFKVNPGDLLYQWNQLPGAGVLHPYTWNGNLGQSSLEYAKLVVLDAGTTTNPHNVPPYTSGLSQRFEDAGYVNWGALGENIAPNFTNNVAYMHAGFAIDWGLTGNGIQNPPGHRNSMLSTTFNEIGIGITPGWTAGNVTQVQHFGDRFNSAAEYVWGYAWTDAAADGYTFGEGMQGLTVEIVNGSNAVVGTTQTDANGGYTVNVVGLSTGSYTVRLMDGSTQLGTQSVAVSNLGMYHADFGIAAAVPEPSTWLMMMLGGVPLVVRARRAGKGRRAV